MSEDRPKPQYGEYASPEEQAEALSRFGHAAPDLSREPELRHQSGKPASAGESKTTSGRPGFSLNRLVTIFLLIFGLMYLIGGAASFVALPDTLDDFFQKWGIGNYVATPFASAIGVAIVVVQCLVWLIVALICFYRLKANRLSWWLPIVGAFVSLALTVILMAVVIGADPAFVAFVNSA